jgi:hypothetical protein
MIVNARGSYTKWGLEPHASRPAKLPAIKANSFRSRLK